MATVGESRNTAGDMGLGLHAQTERTNRVLALVGFALLLFAPFPSLANSKFMGGLDLFAFIEITGAVLGMVTGFAMVLRFYLLGNRFHLYVGLAYFVNGMEDFVHGAMCLGGALGLPNVGLREFIPATYATEHMLMGLLLILALVLPDWLRANENRLFDTLRVSLIALTLTLLVALLTQVPIAAGQIDYPSARLAGIVSAGTLAIALSAYLVRYIVTGEMLTWWIALSLTINAVGQILMLQSTRTFDASFDIAHVYKVVGYLLPMFGFVLYQVTVVLDYERSRAELIKAREMALAGTEAKSSFLANVSHEIRTPMNGIIGMTTRAMRFADNPEQRECLLTVRDCASDLLMLIDEILDFSKIEAGKFILDEGAFDLRKSVASALRALKATAEDKGLTLTYRVDDGIPTVLVGDANRLRQVLLNLVGNALKFTEKGSIEVTVDILADNGAEGLMLMFQVNDTGIGIPADKHRMIFDAFSQADGSTARRFGGTGLGLAISSRLVRLMGGRIDVSSKPGQGSTFRFSMRTKVAGANEVFNSSSGDFLLPTLKASRPRTVLVVEDNPVNLRVTSAMLRDFGHLVKVATNGLEALSLLDEQTVDIVLMDVQMPGMSGLEAATLVRQRERERGRKRVPMIALTAHALPTDQRRCLAAGMDNYLTKPVEWERLFALIERMTGGNPRFVKPEVPSVTAGDDTVTSINTADPPNPEPVHSEPTPTDGETIAELDWDGLVSQLGGNRDLARELVEIFLTQATESLAKTEQLPIDRPGCSADFHKLAGSAGAIGAHLLRAEWSHLEQIAHTADEQEIKEGLGRVTHCLDRLRQSFESTFPVAKTES